MYLLVVNFLFGSFSLWMAVDMWRTSARVRMDFPPGAGREPGEAEACWARAGFRARAVDPPCLSFCVPREDRTPSGATR